MSEANVRSTNIETIMNNTITNYIQFISNQNTINDRCMDFILQHIGRIDEDGIRELIMDYIKTDLYDRYNEIESHIHKHNSATD